MWTFLARSFAGNSLRVWLLALLASILSLTLIGLLKRVATARVRPHEAHAVTWVDELLLVISRRTGWYFPSAVALSVAGFILDLPDRVESGLRALTLTAVMFQVAYWLHHAIRHGTDRYIALHHEDPAVRASASLISLISRVIVWVTLSLLVLGNLHVDISALLTGLGIGGIAVALAVQNVLGDVLASLTLALDRPFVPGDLISVDDYVGEVETVGIKTTQLRSQTGERLVFSNTDLVKSRIRNFRAMESRRIVSTFQCVASTPLTLLESIPAVVREAVLSVSETRFERATLRTLGDPAYVFDVVFHVERSDLIEVAERQHAVNLAIVKALHAAGVTTSPTPAPAAPTPIAKA